MSRWLSRLTAAHPAAATAGAAAILAAATVAADPGAAGPAAPGTETAPPPAPSPASPASVPVPPASGTAPPSPAPPPPAARMPGLPLGRTCGRELVSDVLRSLAGRCAAPGNRRPVPVLPVRDHADDDHRLGTAPAAGRFMMPRWSWRLAAATERRMFA